METFNESGKTGLSLKINWNTDNTSVTGDLEIFGGSGLLDDFFQGYHGDITVQIPDTTFKLTINDAVSLQDASGKVAAFVGCNLAAYGGIGLGVNVNAQLYAKAPLATSVQTYAACVDDCIREVVTNTDDLAVERLQNGIDKFSCIRDCLSEESALGAGVGVKLATGIGEGASLCLEITSAARIAVGLNEKIETHPRYVPEIIDSNVLPVLSEFLFQANQVAMILGRLPVSHGKLLRLPVDLLHAVPPFLSASKNADILKGLLSNGCQKDTMVKLYLGLSPGVDISAGGGVAVNGEISIGLETNLKTLLAAFTFDGVTIDNEGYGAAAIKQTIGLKLKTPILVSAQAAFVKDLLKVKGQRNGVAISAMQILATVGLADVTISADAGLDTDSDGLYDILKVNGALTVDTAGPYTLGGMLYKGTTCVGFATVHFEQIEAGTHNFTLDFDGLQLRNIEEDGPYTVGAFVVHDGDESTVFSSNSIYTTNPYTHTDFETSALAISGVSYMGVDNDADGLYDFLTAILSVSSEKAMDVIAEGISVGEGLSLFGSGTGALMAGTSQIEILFDGKQIRKSGVNSPFELRFTVFDDHHEPLSTFDDTAEGFSYSDFQLPDISLSNMFTVETIDSIPTGFLMCSTSMWALL
jgi:hypothetical protein